MLTVQSGRPLGQERDGRENSGVVATQTRNKSQFPHPAGCVVTRKSLHLSETQFLRLHSKDIKTSSSQDYYED